MAVCVTVCVFVCEREISELFLVGRSRSVEVFGGLVAIDFASTWHLVLASI